MKSIVYFVVPAGWDDQRRSSGGNRYDRELARELGELGWDVRVKPVVGSELQGRAAGSTARLVR
ncbi:hypothetical protein ACIBUY_03850 [Streptomyces sp. NPDC050085]|uniref:hypothetical protein n=1 Tax=Streptomyces sp. NPDC050085 TaxID=3365600 RepID=UPI003799ADCD